MPPTINRISSKKDCFSFRREYAEEHYQGWELTKAVNNKYKVFKRSCAGAKKTSCQDMFP